MPIPINKLNMSSNSQFLSKSRLSSFEHLKKWALAINSSISTVQQEWNRIVQPLLSSLPQVDQVNAWIHGLDGRAIYANREANESDQWHYNTDASRPYSIKEQFDNILRSVGVTKQDIEALKRRAENAIRYYYTTNVYSTFPVGYINGLNLIYNDVDKVDVSVGVCKSDDGTTDIRLKEGVTLDIDDDLDTGTESSSQWYYIWIFYNPSTEATSLKFSEQYPGSGSDPTAPDGYTKKRYIGSVRNNSSGNFLNFIQSCIGEDREFYYVEEITKKRILSAGAAGSWTPIDTSDLIPDTGHLGIFQCYILGTGRPQFFLGPKGANLNVERIRDDSSNADGVVRTVILALGEDNDIEYYLQVGTGTMNVEVSGYRESLEVTTIPDAATPTNATVITTNAYPPGYINGLNLTYTDVDQVTVSSGYCRSDDNTADIVLDSDTLMDIDNDLDTGTESSSQWYYVWIFYNPTTEATSLKFSLQYPGSGSDPTAPDGYTKKRYLGSVYNNSSSNFDKYHQQGNGNKRIYQRDEMKIVLSAGTAGSWTDISFATVVSAMAISCGLSCQVNGSTGDFYLRPNGSSSSVTEIISEASLNGMRLSNFTLGADSKLEYYRAGGTGSIRLRMGDYTEYI